MPFRFEVTEEAIGESKMNNETKIPEYWVLDLAETGEWIIKGRSGERFCVDKPKEEVLAFIEQLNFSVQSRSRWLQRARRFDLGRCPTTDLELVIEARPQRDESIKWVVQIGSTRVLGKDGEWHYEPMSSSRTEAFIQHTRFNSYLEAYDTWVTRQKKTYDANEQAKTKAVTDEIENALKISMKPNSLPRQ